MKKIFTLFLIFLMLIISIPVNAVGSNSYKCTVHKNDMSGENYQLYLSNCVEHYANDEVTVYITNTSDHDALFQVTVGYNGSTVQTSLESGYVKLDTGVTGKFVLSDISRYPEKANNDTGFVPGSALGEKSVIRIQAKGLKANDTFLISGLTSYSQPKDTSFKEVEPNAIMTVPTDYTYINDAKRVIKKETEEKNAADKFNGYTLTQPDSESVEGFLRFVVTSAIVCVGGIVIYMFSFIIRRRKKR